MLEEICSHDIEVLNLNENEVVKHSILLIRGKITTHCRYTEKCASKIFLYHEKECFAEPCENEEFKFIVELKKYTEVVEGEVVRLELHFKYCTAERSLRLYLEKPRSAYRLQPIYILCADETESNLSKTHCDQIDVNLRLVQALYADRIRQAIGCSLTTFVINGACQIYRSDLTREEAWNSDEHYLWSYFAEELLRGNFFVENCDVKLKIVAFIGCTKYDGNALASDDLSYGNIRKHLKGHAALGGGDLALFGSCFFYAWPKRVDEIISCLQNTREVNHYLEADESNYRRTYLGVYATTLGAVCHELGHIFDLAHTQDGIMGTGFDYVNRLLTITNRTENLPKRIIGNLAVTKPVQKTAAQSRLTSIKRNTNSFLDNFREQKNNDCFFFTRNCAIILAHNKWFKNLSNLQTEAVSVNITFDAVENIVSCDSQALNIIEIRAKLNSLVEKYFEFSETQFSFQLPKHDFERREETHYLYVQTVGGESKRFDFLKSDKENLK